LIYGGGPFRGQVKSIRNIPVKYPVFPTTSEC